MSAGGSCTEVVKCRYCLVVAPRTAEELDLGLDETERGQAAPGCRFHAEGQDVPVADCAAATLVATARSALGLSAAELAAAAGCRVELVAAIEEGRFDPTLDTVGRLVNSAGCEIRAGTDYVPHPRYGRVDSREVERLASEYGRRREFAARFGLGPPGPLKGTQPEWDGEPPAPARLFGAGRTRSDGGGWGALLIAGERRRLKMDREALAAASGVDVRRIARIEAGDERPPLGDVQRILAAMGASLRVRLEVYDPHDDSLHLAALEDPEGYEQRLRDAKAELAEMTVLG